MKFKDHMWISTIVFAICTYVTYSLNIFDVTPLFYIIYYPVFIIGAILPDIDHVSSKPRRLFNQACALLIAIFIVLEKSLIALIPTLLLLSLNGITKHRGFLHSHWFGVVLLYIVSRISIVPAIALYSGYFIHLVIDGL